MRKSKFSEVQIAAILKEAEAGVTVAEVARKHGISAVNRPGFPGDSIS
jgi:putative transposase